MSGATHSETMRSNCGTWRLPQENESSPVAFHPIPVPRQSKFRDLNSETQQYRPDYPMQSYLENRSPVITNSHSLFSHEHCITSAYGSHANPTSTPSGMSQYMSQWRSVARWETNGADLLQLYKYGNEAESHLAMIQLRKLSHPPGQMNEKGLINPSIPASFEYFYDNTYMAPSPALMAYMRKKSKEYGQIASLKPCSDLNVDSFPSSKVALISPNISHSDDISANPSRSPLSPSLSTPSPPPFFSRPSNISENPEWSSSWRILPPLREMVPLPTYQVPVVSASSGASVDDARAINDPETALLRCPMQ